MDGAHYAFMPRAKEIKSMYNELATIDERGVSHSRYTTYLFETDRYERARLAFYFSIIQEAAGVHAALRGLSLTDLRSEGVTWVITRNRVKVHRYVRWGEVVYVKTWATQPVRLHMPRIIEGYDKEGVLIFRSTTLWAILDKRNGKPQRPQVYSDRMVLPAPDDADYPITITMPKPINGDEAVVLLASSDVTPTYDDTDRNHHVNNLSYLNWALGALPSELRDQYNITTIDASYLKQTFLTDELSVQTWGATAEMMEEDEPSFFHRIVRKDGEAVWEAHSKWKKREEFRA